MSTSPDDSPSRPVPADPPISRNDARAREDAVRHALDMLDGHADPGPLPTPCHLDDDLEHAIAAMIEDGDQVARVVAALTADDADLLHVLDALASQGPDLPVIELTPEQRAFLAGVRATLDVLDDDLDRDQDDDD